MDIHGHWSGFGVALTVIESNGELLVDLPDAPVGFEPRLVANDGGWQLEGGPFHGTPVTLDGDALVLGDTFRLDRMAEKPQQEPGTGLLAPPPPEPDERFVDAWEQARAAAGGVLDLGGLPTADFVQWLMAQDAVIFHGSNDRGIDEFLPRRTSVELHDAGGRGNQGAVYGTHDGLWSLFFAVVDRPNLRGSIRNGVTRYTSPEGEHVDVYQFSVSDVSLPERPFTNGALYLLPRRTFTRAPFFHGGPLSSEWVSHEPVRPIARIHVTPDDFPFLDRVGGHDDGPLLELEDLTAEVMSGTFEAERIEGGFAFVTTAQREAVDRWAELASQFLPDTHRGIQPVEGGLHVTVTGPPAVVHVLEGRLADLL